MHDLTPDAVLLAPDRSTSYHVSSVRERRHLLGVWAHPDDESYLSAGLMGRAIAAGDRVTLVTLTDGEAGFPENDRRPLAERAQLRRRELRSAMERIGVTDVRFVGLPDGGVADHGDALVGHLGDTMRSLQPDVIATFGPDGITGHDDHVANWRAVTRAWVDVGVGDLWYAAFTVEWLDEWRNVHDDFGVWMTGEPEGIDPRSAVARLELRGDELARKRSVLGEHASQTVGIATALGEDTYRSWIRQETFRRPTADDVRAAVRPEEHLLAGVGS
jgi:LmbE family N-acetylglucosaminyl deacetylase